MSLYSRMTVWQIRRRGNYLPRGVAMTERQCAVYARYSSEKQNSLTIEQQVRKCREYAERHGFAVLDAHIYTDEAISGATDNRARLQRLLAAATQKPRAFDVILVDDTSRLSRNMIDSLKIFEQLRFVNVRTIFVAQGIDTESEQAELLSRWEKRGGGGTRS